jgi:hypothetical protein
MTPAEEMKQRTKSMRREIMKSRLLLSVQKVTIKAIKELAK